MALRDAISVTIFALDVNCAIDVESRRINAPFEAIRMVGSAGKRSVGLGYTTIGLYAVEFPLWNQVVVELSNVKRSRGNTRRGADSVAHSSAGVAVEAPLFVVMVVFDHDRVGPVVDQDGRRRVPAEVEEGHDRTGGSIELNQVTTRDVVARVGAVENISVRQDGW